MLCWMLLKAKVTHVAFPSPERTNLSGTRLTRRRSVHQQSEISPRDRLLFLCRPTKLSRLTSFRIKPARTFDFLSKTGQVSIGSTSSITLPTNSAVEERLANGTYEKYNPSDFTRARAVALSTLYI